MRIRAWTTGGEDDAEVWFRLNHVPLHVTRQGGWFEADVPAGVPRAGLNELAIWCDKEAVREQRPLVVHRVFGPVQSGRA